VSPRGWALAALLVAVPAGLGAWRFWLAGEPSPPPPRSASPRFAPEEDAPRRREALGPAVRQEPRPAPEAGVERRWAEKNREGIQALEAGRYDEAARLFDECRLAVPAERVFAQNMAEALARHAGRELEQGSVEGRARALELLQRARELVPERADVAQRLEQVERLATSEKGLWTDTSEHFELSYDGERSDLLWSSTQITQELEAAYQDLGERFARWPVENGRPRIRVVLYRREGFHAATGIGHWAGGLYDGSVRVPVEELQHARRSDLVRVLRHEIVHAFVAEAGGREVPGWLNEGLAQWLERSVLSEQQRSIAEAREGLRGKPLLTLEELERPLSTLKEEEKIHRAYQQSLAVVDVIERTVGERVLYQMVEGCKRGAAPAITFKTRTGHDLAALLADLSRELATPDGR
jgi:hypothetical protein